MCKDVVLEYEQHCMTIRVDGIGGPFVYTKSLVQLLSAFGEFLIG